MSGLVAETDVALGFIIPGRHARGRVVRLRGTLDAILSAHGYPPVIETLLAEALTVTALLGAMLKDAGGQLTLQAQTEGGAVSLLVCDYRGGQLRGYVQHDPARVAGLPKGATLSELFGPGYLAITFDQQPSGERYQGIVPCEGSSLAAAVENYFLQSEQIPSMVRVGFAGDVAGGLLVQHLPEGEEGRERLHTRLDHPEWDHVRILAQTITPDELTDADLPLETLLWRLFNEEEEVRLLARLDLARGCRCDPEHIRSVIAQFSAEDRAEMAGDDGMIRVDCEFCARSFPIDSQ